MFGTCLFLAPGRVTYTCTNRLDSSEHGGEQDVHIAGDDEGLVHRSERVKSFSERASKAAL